MTMRFGVGDIDVCYAVRGAGPALVFLHGLAADRHQSDRCLGALDGFRVVTIDMPGHGDSPLSGRRPLAEQVGFRFQAHVVRELLRHLEIRTAFVGGISMGAGVAIALAIESAELVEGLLLVRPAWVDSPGRPQLDLIADLGVWMAADGAAIARQRLAADPRFVDMQHRIPRCADGLVETTRRAHVVAAPMVLPETVEDQPYRTRADLEACTVPAVVVSGDHDPLHPRWVADRLEAALPNATARAVPARYLEPIAHQRGVVSAIRTFLDRCVDTSTNSNRDSTGAPT